MRPIPKIATLAVVALLVATVYGLFRTKGQPNTSASTFNSSNGGTQAGSVVDLSTLRTARWLAQMPTTSEERQVAEDALHLADKEHGPGICNGSARGGAASANTERRGKRISSLNEDGETNLAPISSFWTLGWTIVLGLLNETKTADNLRMVCGEFTRAGDVGAGGEACTADGKESGAKVKDQAVSLRAGEIPSSRADADRERTGKAGACEGVSGAHGGASIRSAGLPT